MGPACPRRQPDHPGGQPRRRRRGARALRPARRGHPQRRLPARLADRRVPRGPLGRADRVLLTSPFLLARYGWEQLARAATAATSRSRRSTGSSASPFKAGYVAAKHGVLGLVKSLALEGADHGIVASAESRLRAHAARRETRSPTRPRRHGMSEDRGAREGHPRPARGQAADRAGRGGRCRRVPARPRGARAFTGAPVTMDLGWSAWEVSALEAIVLGIVQGLTEFLPISSTAHLRIVPAFAGWEDPGAAFTAVTQPGTMAAVLLYFRHDLWRIARVHAARRCATPGRALVTRRAAGLLHPRRHDPDRGLRAAVLRADRERRAQPDADRVHADPARTAPAGWPRSSPATSGRSTTFTRPRRHHHGLRAGGRRWCRASRARARR